MNTYTCWHGELEDRYEESQVAADNAVAAAMKYALQHDIGEESDIVFVLVQLDGVNRVLEYKCLFQRVTQCDVKFVSEHKS